MRAALSVIIPTLNAAESLPGCLLSLMPGLEAGLIRELILSDGGSTDSTTEIAAHAGATLLSGPPSRGGQLRRGTEAARGSWMLILHADSRLPEGWTDLVDAHMRDAPDSAGYFRLRFDDDGLPARLVAGWANLRSRWLGLPYGDQGVLIPRALLADAGGYPDMPLMEDVALARALKGRMRALPGTMTTSADRYRREGWLGRGSRNLIQLTRYLSGTPPETLARSYRRRS